MATTEESLRDQLADASPSIGSPESDTGWSIHIGKAPTTPDQAIVITRAPGSEPDPKWLLDFTSVQIRVRGGKGSYRDAEAKARQIKDFLLGFPSQNVGGDRWVSITMPSDYSFIGFDQNERPTFVLNIRMIIEPAPTPGTNRQPI